MSWRNASLVDVEYTFNVDTSKLEERLDEIEQKLSAVEPVDEERVQAMIDEHTHDDIDEDRVKDIVRDMMHSEGDEYVQGVIDGNDFVTGDDVDQKIRDADLPDESRVSVMIDDALDSSDFVDRDAVLDILREEGLDSNAVADAEEVETLKADLADLTRRFEMYASRVDDLMQSTREVSERQANRIMEIERKNQTALDFFGLIEQAFNLLRRGA